MQIFWIIHAVNGSICCCIALQNLNVQLYTCIESGAKVVQTHLLTVNICRIGLLVHMCRRPMQINSQVNPQHARVP